MKMMAKSQEQVQYASVCVCLVKFCLSHEKKMEKLLKQGMCGFFFFLHFLFYQMSLMHCTDSLFVSQFAKLGCFHVVIE